MDGVVPRQVRLTARPHVNGRLEQGWRAGQTGEGGAQCPPNHWGCRTPSPAGQPPPATRPRRMPQLSLAARPPRNRGQVPRGQRIGRSARPVGQPLQGTLANPALPRRHAGCASDTPTAPPGEATSHRSKSRSSRSTARRVTSGRPTRPPAARLRRASAAISLRSLTPPATTPALGASSTTRRREPTGRFWQPGTKPTHQPRLPSRRTRPAG